MRGSVQVAFPVFLNQWYHLKATLTGAILEVEVDGEFVQINDWSDDNLPERGVIGLAIGGGEAYIDNVVITGDEVPDSRGLAVAPIGKLTVKWAQIRRAE